MKISFVIPAYNEEKLLPQCLASIQKEITKGNYDAELIVVNNASTDKTGDIARSFSGVKVVDESRKGLTFARQAGFEASSGDLIANVDADTMLPEGWIKTVLDEFSHDKNLVGLSGPYVHYDFSPFMRVVVRVYYRLAVMGGATFFQGGNFVLRREGLQKIGGFDTSIAFYGEDTDIALRIKKMGKVKFTFKLPMYTTARRMHGEGLITTVWHYAVNFFWTTFTGRPYSQHYTDVRP